MKKAIHIFYKDLNFHHGLHAIGADHYVLPLFLWSEALNQDVDATPSLNYRLTWAKAFNRQLLPNNVNLLVVATIEEIVNMCMLYNIDVVTMLAHYEPRERQFQAELKAALTQVNIRLKLYSLYTLIAPGKVLKGNGQPYVTFTPFYKKWREQLNVFKIKKQTIRWIAQPVVPRIGCRDMSAAIQADFNQWQTFLSSGWRRYIEWRDYPAERGTSQLSAMLNHGLINVHTALKALVALPHNDNVEAVIRQLAWRDFFIDILMRYPNTVSENFNQSIRIPWSNQAMDFQTWCEGRTGYPIVDAAMLELYQTGRMHNRLRMIVASFLTKDLLIHWREGAQWFKEHLIDYDLALNTGGWQWAASTGVDAVPYFRIFNPTTQSEKYDPMGTYIKSVITDLASAPMKKVHHPQKYGIPYTARCVEHAVARKLFLDKVKMVKSSK